MHPISYFKKYSLKQRNKLQYKVILLRLFIFINTVLKHFVQCIKQAGLLTIVFVSLFRKGAGCESNRGAQVLLPPREAGLPYAGIQTYQLLLATSPLSIHGFYSHQERLDSLTQESKLVNYY